MDPVMRKHTYKLGNDFYLQTEGAPIGLQMSGEIGRICCMMWDRLYKQELANNQIEMPMFGRYVDDGNMNYKVPMPVEDEEGVEAFKDKLLHIANGLMDGIEMEADLPRNHPNKKLPILNMMVWIEDGVLYYEHYEKEVSSKRLIPFRCTWWPSSPGARTHPACSTGRSSSSPSSRTTWSGWPRTGTRRGIGGWF